MALSKKNCMVVVVVGGSWLRGCGRVAEGERERERERERQGLAPPERRGGGG